MPLYFLDLKALGIDGESKKQGHEKQLEMDTWSFSITQTGSAARGEAAATGRVNMNDFSFGKLLDKSSPMLMRAGMKGEYIDNIIFFAQKTGTIGGQYVDYLRVTFRDCIISRYQNFPGQADAPPAEDIAFSFKSVKMDYKFVDEKGKPGALFSGGFDSKENRKV